MKYGLRNTLVIFCFLFLFSEVWAGATHAQLGPPEKNPHPAVTDADQKRVQFAEHAVQSLLMSESREVKTREGFSIFDMRYRFDLDEKCLQNPECPLQNPELVQYLGNIKALFGKAVKIQHTHVIPWSWTLYQSHKSDKTKSLIYQEPPSKPEVNRDEPPPERAPNQRKDEYMIHTYVQFSDGVWRHVDVYLSEDESGRLVFRRFFITDINQPKSSMPEGAVC